MTSLHRGTCLWSRKRNCAGHPGERENAAGALRGGYTCTQKKFDIHLCDSNQYKCGVMFTVF